LADPNLTATGSCAHALHRIGKTAMDLKLLNILLVDDDDVDVMNVQRAFKKNNIINPLYIAHNGVEALAILRGGDKAMPSQRRLVLLDLNMPKMNGLEFLRELRSDPALRALTVIVLTTSDDERDKVEAYNLNVAGYIVKPVTFISFVEAVAALNTYWSINELP
jgi:CheY-like chemotaxis protein